LIIEPRLEPCSSEFNDPALYRLWLNCLEKPKDKRPTAEKLAEVLWDHYEEAVDLAAVQEIQENDLVPAVIALSSVANPRADPPSVPSDASCGRGAKPMPHGLIVQSVSWKEFDRCEFPLKRLPYFTTTLEASIPQRIRKLAFREAQEWFDGQARHKFVCFWNVPVATVPGASDQPGDSLPSGTIDSPKTALPSFISPVARQVMEQLPNSPTDPRHLRKMAERAKTVLDKTDVLARHGRGVGVITYKVFDNLNVLNLLRSEWPPEAIDVSNFLTLILDIWYTRIDEEKLAENARALLAKKGGGAP
jgi:hypothetical protein